MKTPTKWPRKWRKMMRSGLSNVERQISIAALIQTSAPAFSSSLRSHLAEKVTPEATTSTQPIEKGSDLCWCKLEDLSNRGKILSKFA